MIESACNEGVHITIPYLSQCVVMTYEGDGYYEANKHRQRHVI